MATKMNAVKGKAKEKQAGVQEQPNSESRNTAVHLYDNHDVYWQARRGNCPHPQSTYNDHPSSTVNAPTSDLKWWVAVTCPTSETCFYVDNNSVSPAMQNINDPFGPLATASFLAHSLNSVNYTTGPAAGIFWIFDNPVLAKMLRDLMKPNLALPTKRSRGCRSSSGKGRLEN